MLLFTVWYACEHEFEADDAPWPPSSKLATFCQAAQEKWKSAQFHAVLHAATLWRLHCTQKGSPNPARGQ